MTISSSETSQVECTSFNEFFQIEIHARFFDIYIHMGEKCCADLNTWFVSYLQLCLLL